MSGWLLVGKRLSSANPVIGSVSVGSSLWQSHATHLNFIDCAFMLFFGRFMFVCK